MTAMNLIAGWCLAVAVALAGTPARSLPEGRILIRAAHSGALEQVTLPTLRREVVVPVPCERWQSGSGIAIVDERRVIWACGEAPSRLYLFDLESGSLVMVGEGNRPVYLARHGLLLFQKGSGLGYRSLYMARLDLEPEPILQDAVRIEKVLPASELTAVANSNEEVLFESRSHLPLGSPSGERKTFRLNVTTMQREELPAFRTCSLESVWRATTRQVLCKLRDPNTFVVELDRWMLMNPDDGSTQPLPLRQVGVGVTYVPEADAALLSIVEDPHEGYDLWLYEFRSGKLTRLPPGPHAFSHDAVSIPARQK